MYVLRTNSILDIAKTARVDSIIVVKNLGKKMIDLLVDVVCC